MNDAARILELVYPNGYCHRYCYAGPFINVKHYRPDCITRELMRDNYGKVILNRFNILQFKNYIVAEILFSSDDDSLKVWLEEEKEPTK